MGATSLTHDVYLNGQYLDAVTSFSWDEFPAHRYQEFSDVSTLYDRRIRLTSYKKGKGSMSILAPLGTYSNDPMDLMDMFGFKSTYTTYNTSTEKLETSSTVYDWTPSDGTSLSQPLVPHEIRQVEAKDDIAIESAGDFTEPFFGVAQVFRAHCTDLTTLKLKLRDVALSDVTSLDVKLYNYTSEGFGLQVTGSATVNETGMTITDGATFADATWVSIDISSIMGTASLTPGELYAIVIEATDADTLYLCTTDSNRYSPGGLYTMSGADSFVAGTADGQAFYDLAFILQGTDSYGGHNLIIYDYTSSDTYYTKFSCYGSRVNLTNVEIQSDSHITANLEFASERIETTKG